MRTSPLTSLLLLALVAPAPLLAEVEIEVRLWQPDLDGRVQVSDSLPGTEIDLLGDLGVESDDPLEGRFTWRPTKRNRIRLAYYELDLSGSTRIERDITFAGRRFPLATDLVAELRLEYGRLGWIWQPLWAADGAFRLGPLMEVKGFRGKASLAAPDLPLSPAVSEDFESGFASAGLVLDLVPLDRLRFSAEWTTLIDTGDGDLTDFEAEARFYPVEALALYAGWRSIDIDLQREADLLDLQLEGVYFGAGLRF